jgi:hypothetical protein
MKIPLVQGREFTDRRGLSPGRDQRNDGALADADPIGKRSMRTGGRRFIRRDRGVARDTPSFIGNTSHSRCSIAFAQRPARVQSSHAGTRIQMSFLLRDRRSAARDSGVRHAAGVDPRDAGEYGTVRIRAGGRSSIELCRCFSAFRAAALLLAAIGILA